MTAGDRGHRGTVTVERSYRASLAEIWDLWTTKDGFESWWGPQGFRVAVTELDARGGGGVLLYEMVADTPEMIAAMKRMGATGFPPRERPLHRV